MKGYLTTKEYAKKHNREVSNICRLCKEGKIKAEKIGNSWLIPEDEPYPQRKEYVWSNPEKNKGYLKK